MGRKWLTFPESIDLMENGQFPGIYIFAYSEKKLEDREISIDDIFYVGMSNAVGGVKSRVNQFNSCIEGNAENHSGGKRFFNVFSNEIPYSEFGGDKKLYFQFFTLPCDVRKRYRSASDLRRMGLIAKLEYEMLAFIKENTGNEPELNKK